ncbi:MAG: hypothetical protein IPK80_25675 [Nannocystis sp.]|nr:hypothetical protein [Nannocystis sp.]
MGRLVVLIGVLAAGCLVDNPLFSDKGGGETMSGESSTGGSTSAAETTTGVTTSTTSSTGASSTGAMTLDTSYTGVTSVTSDTSDTSDTSGTSGSAEEPPYLPGVFSCKEAHKTDPALPSGIYRVDVEGRAQTVDLYCDMDVVGGGWTLVGRSVAMAGGDFGWSSQRGAVEDDSGPYSLGIAALGISFSELLVGDRGEGKSWGENAFVLSGVPVGFVDMFQESELTLGLASLPSNVCPATEDVLMLRYAGRTALVEVFWLRDMPYDGKYYGLQAGGFDLFYHDLDDMEACWRTGKMSTKQGMIMVR